MKTFSSYTFKDQKAATEHYEELVKANKRNGIVCAEAAALSTVLFCADWKNSNPYTVK